MENNMNYVIPKEKFEFANLGDKLHDQKFDDKPIGYFKDAWIRFKKNKASIVASIIIISIILFSIFMPLFNTRYDASFIDPFYPKKGPRIPALTKYGIASGNENRNRNERGLLWDSAIAVGSLHTPDVMASGEEITIGDGLNSKLSPVLDYTKRSKGKYEEKIDTYLAVGFEYVQVTQQEYQNILQWQTENGIQILYPIIATNEYNFDGKNEDANFWFKVDNKNKNNAVKINKDGEMEDIEFSEDVVFEDNYKRDENGNVMYWEFTGGGDFSTAAYRVRVLYYNYYQYKNGFEPKYIFGTDSQGYDLSLRLADGIRLSLLVSLVVCAINFVIGAIYGAIAGYYGGAVDLTMERITDILSGIPSVVLMTLFQLHFAQKVGVIPSLLFAFVLTGWIGMSSRVRTQFYRFKNQEYVMAARTLGARDRRIIWKHIFPNTLGTIITGSVLAIPGVIFTESMLSFLGIVNLGGAETTSLGTLLSDASSIWTNYPHLMLVPAIIISLLMICFNLFGNGLRDAFNPSLRGVEE